MSGNLFSIVCLVLALNMQGSLSQVNNIKDTIKDKLGIPKSIDTYSENGNHGLTHTFDNGNQIGPHANVDFKNGINVNNITGQVLELLNCKSWKRIEQSCFNDKKNYAIEGVGLHGKLNLGNGWEAKGEFNKGVGSNDGFSGGVSVSKSWWRRKRSIACMEQCNHACRRSTDTCEVNCIRNMC